MASGSIVDMYLPSPSAPSPLYTPRPVATPSPAAISVGPPPSFAVSPTTPVTSSSGDDPDRHILVLSDDSGSIYTTTIYSTQGPPSTTNSTPADVHQIRQSAPSFAAIIAGVGGGVGLLLLVVGVTWYIWVRRAKRRAGITLIKDRKFYPDRYNQTITNSRHSEFNEIEPGPVVFQPPPPPLLPRYPSTLSSGPLSRHTSYQNHISSPVVHGGWAGAPPMDGILEDASSLARHRAPYPSSPVQPPVDRYTVLPSRSTSSSNSPTSLRFALPPPPQHPRHFRPPSATHRRYHSHQSYYNPPQCQGPDLESDSYFTPIATPPPSPLRVARRYTVFISPPMSPSSFSTISSPRNHPGARAEQIMVTPTRRSPIVRSTFSSADSQVVAATTRMVVVNPDSDVDPETDTEPEGPSCSGRGGSPSATDIIRLYSRDLDRDQDTSSSSSVVKGKDPSSVFTNSIPVSLESS